MALLGCGSPYLNVVFLYTGVVKCNEVVKCNNIVTATHKMLNEVAADETRATRDEYLHCLRVLNEDNKNPLFQLDDAVADLVTISSK